MALSGSASNVIPGIAANPLPSVAKPYDLGVSFAGVPSINNFSVVTGISAGAPATKVGMTNQIITGPFDSNASNVLFTKNLDTTYSGRLTRPIAGLGGAPGNHAWVCLFELNSGDLVDGSVPTLALGPFTMVA